MILSALPEALLCFIPGGAAGIRKTLKIMARMVRQGRTDLAIRQKAAALTGASYTSEVQSCFTFVRDEIRYLGDICDVETLQEPGYTLTEGYGDCDDKSILLASLLESIGHPCRFTAAGYERPGEFQHVWVETLIGRDWVACETTLPVELGWSPMPPNIDQSITAFMREYI